MSTWTAADAWGAAKTGWQENNKNSGWHYLPPAQEPSQQQQDSSSSMNAEAWLDQNGPADLKFMPAAPPPPATLRQPPAPLLKSVNAPPAHLAPAQVPAKAMAKGPPAGLAQAAKSSEVWCTVFIEADRG